MNIQQSTTTINKYFYRVVAAPHSLHTTLHLTHNQQLLGAGDKNIFEIKNIWALACVVLLTASGHPAQFILVWRRCGGFCAEMSMFR